MRVQVLFAPEDGVAQKIAERIDAGEQPDPVPGVLVHPRRHGQAGDSTVPEAGVQVSGVFEKTGSETRFSEFTAMKQAGLDVYQDGNPYAMHHKVFVLDGRTTIFGSFNFSDGADRDNDENVLIVDDPGLRRVSSSPKSSACWRSLATRPRPAPTPERERPAEHQACFQAVSA